MTFRPVACVCIAAATTVLPMAPAHGQILINEANTVGAGNGTTDFLDGNDASKPYEGWDYGVVPASGNQTYPDIDTVAPGTQASLPNGWTPATGWGRINANGGDWLELVVTSDKIDLRGYTVYWENADGTSGIGNDPEGRGAFKFTQNGFWTGIRGGTIVTISEQSSVDEIVDSGATDSQGEIVGSDTGFNYDLSTDLSYDPIGNRTKAQVVADVNAGTFQAHDGHVHLHLDESLTDNGIATQYFEAFSDIKVDNDDWRAAIFDASNTTLTPQNVESPGSRASLDLTTGLVAASTGNPAIPGFIGESTPTFGVNVGGSNVNSAEAVTYLGDITADGFADTADYEDTDFSSFGRPNVYNEAVETTLDGVQNFSGAYGWLRDIVEGDSDYDGDVDTADITTTIGNFTGASAGNGEGWAAGNYDGDGDVDTADVTTAIGNFTGAGGGVSLLAASVVAASPGNPDLIYDPLTGDVFIDADGATILSFNLQSDDAFNAVFDQDQLNDDTANFDGLVDNLIGDIGWVSALATANIGYSGVNNDPAFIGAILDPGLSQSEYLSLFTNNQWAGPNATSGAFDLVYVPEPAALALLAAGCAVAAMRRRKAA